jgi:DNA-binding NarL/FixJ family response regulator
MSLEQAVDETLAWPATKRPVPARVQPDDQPTPAPLTVSPVTRDEPPLRADPGDPPLSPRQLEVAALIARGFTNRQIADELVITEGTAANHVKAILASLGLQSRVQVAVWAIESGLTERSAA